MSCTEGTELQIPGGLTEELVRQLALLSDAPAGVAESTLALMGFGTRSVLADRNPPLIEMSDSTPVRLTITPAGWDAIRACAEAIKGTSGDDWSSRRADEEDSWTKNHRDKLDEAIGTLEASEGQPV